MYTPNHRILAQYYAKSESRSKMLLSDKELKALYDKLDELQRWIDSLKLPKAVETGILRGIIALPEKYGDTQALEARVAALEKAGDDMLAWVPFPNQVNWKKARVAKPGSKKEAKP